MAVACSTTRNLPEGEVLYTGTRRVTYDGQEKKKSKKQLQEEFEQGVILSLADAYHTVDDLLKGNATTSESAPTSRAANPEEERAVRDSLRRVAEVRYQALETAREEVNAALAYAPNNSLLGSSSVRIPLPMGLWTYNRFVGAKGGLGRWIFDTFAATPVYVSTVNPEVRARVAQNTLKNYGFFRGTVGYEVIPQENPRKAKLAYHVMPREIFRLDSIEFRPFPSGADSLVQAARAHTHLHQGAPFSVADLDAERTRLSDLLRNHGYYYHKPQHITYRADTLMRPEHVQLRVLPAPDAPAEAYRPYHLGNIRVTLYQYDNFRLTDSVQRAHFSFHYVAKNGRAPLRLGPMLRYVPYRRGELYHKDLHEGISDRLGSMGVFSQVNVAYVPRPDSLGRDTLDVVITGVLDKPYDGEFETKLTTKSNGQLGPGLSFGLAKRNAFRGAEKLKFNIHGSYEWQTGSDVVGKSSVINSYEYGTSLALEYPRVVAPWFGRRISRRAKATTEYSIDATWLNRAGYFGMVSLGARVAYTYQRRPTLKHEFVPLRFNYDEILHTTARFDSIMSRNEALYVSLRDQFVPSMRYTLTYSSRPTARNPRSFIFEVKEGGNVTSALYAAFGRPFSEPDKKLAGVPFAQYLKFTAEFRDAFRLHRRHRLATRLAVGAIFAYGNSTMAPYADLFSIGGANSVRAFTVRGVGPGSYHPAHSGYSYIAQTGDLKLEANVEYRFPLIADLHGAFFLDAGGVWLRRPDPARPGGTFSWRRLGRDLALGTGLGLRYDLQFLVLRFDVGVGLHAPYDTGRRGYYNMPRFFDSLGYHLAVGYPF